MARIPVAREGWPFVLVPGAVAALLALGGRRRLALPFAAASLASLGFFRDPERITPVAAHGVIAPADGRVTIVDELEDPFVGPALRVSIFLSPFDVHVIRSPITGLVVGTVYTSGRFLPAYRPEAGEENERCAVHIEGERDTGDRGPDRGGGRPPRGVPGGRRRQARGGRADRDHPIRLAHGLPDAAGHTDAGATR